MLKAETIRGGQRVTGVSLSKRKQFMTKPNILRFDPMVQWRKIKLWIKIRNNLECIHQKVINEVMQDPSSPFYTHLEEKSGTIGINRNHYVFFDPSEYRANRQMRTSQEVKRILTLPPEKRSKEEIHCAMIGLRGISAIAEYPFRMQKYLAEFGTFESYRAKRIIVKQGRPPEAFYNILYGRVTVTVKDEVTGTVDVKCHLHRGHSFGELAIIKDSCRLSSVITQNYTELLSIASEIFQKYFMVGGVKNMNDPDVTNFVRSLSFLRGWPIELILQDTNQRNVTFGYFKRGSVLTKDSNYSNWLIIVKSGSLKVLKRLIKVRATVLKKSGLPRNESSSRYLCFLRDGREYLRCLKQNRIILPPPFDPKDGNEELENKNETRETTSLLGTLQTTFMKQRSPLQSLKGVVSAAGNITSTKMVQFKLLKVKKTMDTAFVSPRLSRDRSLSLDCDGVDDSLEFEEKRTFLDEVDSVYKAKAHIQTADFKPQFVCIQTLTKGDVFGLAQCLFCEQPSLCVASNGADCFLINKKLFLDNSSEELIRRLRVEISPYPTDEKLQEDLSTRINWDVYKCALMNTFFKNTKGL